MNTNVFQYVCYIRMFLHILALQVSFALRDADSGVSVAPHQAMLRATATTAGRREAFFIARAGEVYYTFI